MTLEQFFERVEAGVFHLGQRLFGDEPKTERQQQTDELTEKLQRRQAALRECRARIDLLRRGLLYRERRAADLAEQVETHLRVGDQPRAWRCALELDDVRRRLHKDRPQLRQELLACREHDARIRELERDLADLRNARPGAAPVLRTSS